jgi:hypothetical protein
MLSNESKLFKELNLSNSSKSDNPGDFYNYILDLFNDKISSLLALSDCVANNETLKITNVYPISYLLEM